MNMVIRKSVTKCVKKTTVIAYGNGDRSPNALKG